EFVETQVDVTVSKAEPYVKTVSPTAITYGDTLSGSELSGTAQYSSNDTTAVSGTFQWADNTVKPSVSDSGKTWYDVIFTPDDTANYKTAAGRARLTVNKADHPAEMPPESISVPYSVETVSDQILRDINISNWSFTSNDPLSVGAPVTLTAVYNGEDAGNFNTETAQIIVTRSSCEHKGSSHIQNAKDPTCTEEGATGDRYCDICGDLLESSTAIPANGHSWDTGVVTKKPSLKEEGVRTYTCTVCSEQREESIAKLIDISGAEVSTIPARTYNGSSQKPVPTVKYGSATLKSGTDYSLSYKNNLNAGTEAAITITGKGKYGGIKTVNFTIKKASQTITIEASPASIAVGKTATVSISGNKGDKSFKPTTDADKALATVYRLSGKVTAKKVGTVSITVTFGSTANYNAASKTIKIKIVPAATSSITAANLATGIRLTWKKVTGATGYLVYRGSTKIATIKSNSTVTYTDAKANTNGTKYTYKIIPTASTGNGTAKSLVTYRITRPAISSAVNSAAGKATVKWSRNTRGTGYQIHYCMDKTFKTNNNSVSINSASTISKVIGNLQKGKTYYLRIRTYKTVGSKKYFSAWSVVKTVKISK
ncbi:MAG: fibronectin type III domain-containing protein, partial [Lachnospiraceae bacterium]|nr:fibronectin type III domain-containing protein [Lachnospiraceae bacterium]